MPLFNMVGQEMIFKRIGGHLTNCIVEMGESGGFGSVSCIQDTIHADEGQIVGGSGEHNYSNVAFLRSPSWAKLLTKKASEAMK